MFFMSSCGKAKSVNAVGKGHNGIRREAGNRRRHQASAIRLSISNVKLSYEGKNIELEDNVYIDKNRYYIPAESFIEKLGGKIESDDDSNLKFKFNGADESIDVKQGICTNHDDKYIFKKMPVLSQDNIYISLFDLTKIMNLKTRWDTDKQEVSFYKDRDNIKKGTQTGDKIVLLRLEDVAPGWVYSTTDSLEKMRIVSDYLYSNGMPFHIAWVPRYIYPKNKIDNDPASTNSLYNADFIFTLDYMADRGGIIGLHGYTHQYGNTETVHGTEFHTFKNDGIPATPEFAQERVDMAKKAAKDLDIKYYFFESPHYAIMPEQLKVLEKNFDILYQGLNGRPYKKKVDGRSVAYVPAPLDFIDKKNELPKMLNKINNLKKDSFASYFYDPYMEYDDIKVTPDSTGYPVYTYSEDSILHQMNKAFKAKGYKYGSVLDVVSNLK